MCAGLGIDVLSVVAHPVHQASAVVQPPLDAPMAFGCVLAVFTLAVLLCKHEIGLLSPLLAVCLAASGLCAFFQGAWPTGLILLGTAASEVQRIRAVSQRIASRFINPPAEDTERGSSTFGSRLGRMFGSR